MADSIGYTAVSSKTYLGWRRNPECVAEEDLPPEEQICEPISTEDSSDYSTVEARLIGSGHYQYGPDGRVRSVYFPSPQQSPQNTEEYVCPILAGRSADIQAGNRRVLEFHTVYPVIGGAVSYSGLKECVRIEEAGLPPVYVVDNHQMAYFAWMEARQMGYIQPGAVLIHVDGHPDNSPPSQWSEAKDLPTVADYTRKWLQVATFILPALANGTIGQFWDFGSWNDPILGRQKVGMEMKGVFHGNTADVRASYGPLDYTSKGFTKLRLQFRTMRNLLRDNRDPQHVIVDIDLDVLFTVGHTGGLELRHDIDRSLAVEFLANLSRRGGVVTIATSPGFAGQKTAIQLAREIVDKMNFFKLLDDRNK